MKSALGDLTATVAQQHMEIGQLSDEVALQKLATDSLQVPVDIQQSEIEQLAAAASGNGTPADIAIPTPADGDVYTAYLKAAAHDLGSQYNIERRAHEETRQRLAENARLLAAAQKPATESPTNGTG